MFRNRNGYWMSPKFWAMFSPDDGGGAGGTGGAGDGAPGGDGADGNDAAGNGENGGENSGDGSQSDNNSVDSLNAEIARLKAEMAKQKAAMDKAASEASQAKKALKAKMSQEEIDAANKQEAEEKLTKELNDLRREVAKGQTVKSVMGKLGLDEDSAGDLADALYGAADIENVLLGVQKAWQVREAALRKEFGRITGPGAGADSNSPEAQAVRKAQELGKARNAVTEQARKAMESYMR